ncbi:hypothetical protein BDD12DRAFT_504160 [Trichophaea hybrida]|nr:hypothetical protein BDD12DRAFT_504160 [Trichophaea hybrida]
MHFIQSLSLTLLGFAAISSAMPSRPTRKAINIKVANCPLKKAVLPVIIEAGYVSLNSAEPHPPLRVVLGKGTQNYTCADSTAASVPKANGAKAVLYDASCLAENYPDLLHSLPPILLDLNFDAEKYLIKKLHIDQDGLKVGVHYFSNPTTPVFNFQKSKKGGIFVGKKIQNVTAPSTAKYGQNGAVDWLKIDAIDGTTNGCVTAYRVVTAGGKPPTTCAGLKKHFEVPYVTEYWFY